MKLLQIDSSARTSSVTRRLTARFAEEWKKNNYSHVITTTRILPKFYLLIVLLAVPVVGFAQPSHTEPFAEPVPVVDDSDVHRLPSIPELTDLHSEMTALSPGQALQGFQDRNQGQASGLRGYTDETLVIADLPDTSQRGAFQLQRAFVAPRSLKYKPINFIGDPFVKSNVISRMLQSEVDHVEKGDPSQSALTGANYKFSYKGEQRLNEHAVYVYHVKPRHKKPGLFKGHIYLDAHTGNLMRSEGAIAKSPSFFVRKIEFVQDYVEINHYVFPTHLHSTARARILGRVVVDVYHRDYQPQPLSASISATETRAAQP